MKVNQLVVLLISLCLISCKDGKESGKSSRPTGADDAKVQVNISYAKGFQIIHHEGYQVINVFFPGKEEIAYRYLLFKHEKPEQSDDPNTQSIKIPVRNVASLSSIYIAYLEYLGLLDNLIAVDNFRYVNSAKATKRIEAKKIEAVGSGAEVNIEKMVALNPDIVFTYGVGNPKVDSHPHILKAGIPVAVTTDHLETSPLGRAEWIKFIAAFFDRDSVANALFNKIATAYNNSKKLVSSVTTKPTVFTEIKYGDVWYTPGGASYVSKLLEDAGASYIWKEDKHTGSLKLNFEQVLSKASTAEYWIHVHQWNTFKDVIDHDKRNTAFLAFKNGNIYNNNARVNEFGGNDFWESGVINPHIVLQDLIKIFHPEVLPDHQMKYYKKLEN